MNALSEFAKLRFLLLALSVCALTAISTSASSAQKSRDKNEAAALQDQAFMNRAVGAKGRLKRVYWTTGSESDLYEMRLEKQARRLANVTGAMRNTRIWIARADVCGLAGDETLVQIRSPLTCGSLGCELVVLSETTGSPRVLLRTIGNSIDAPAMDELVINQDSNRERAWRYGGGRFQQVGKR